MVKGNKSRLDEEIELLSSNLHGQQHKCKWEQSETCLFFPSCFQGLHKPPFNCWGRQWLWYLWLLWGVLWTRGEWAAPSQRQQLSVLLAGAIALGWIFRIFILLSAECMILHGCLQLWLSSLCFLKYESMNITDSLAERTVLEWLKTNTHHGGPKSLISISTGCRGPITCPCPQHPWRGLGLFFKY